MTHLWCILVPFGAYFTVSGIPCFSVLLYNYSFQSRWKVAEFQSISIWLWGFFSGYSGFPPSSKSTPSQLHLAGFAVLRDHTWIVWRQPWAPSHAFGPIPLSRLILKSPCRERSTKRTFTFTFTLSLSLSLSLLVQFKTRVAFQSYTQFSSN